MAWHCKVKECNFPHLHVSSSHKCGTCGEYGHGQVECGDAAAIKKIKSGKLPKNLQCSLPECSYPAGHVNDGHGCGECGGFGHSAPQCKGAKKAGKKKKATKEPSGKQEKKQKTDSEESSSREGLFYNLAARDRKFEANVKRDKHGNVAGSSGDLGQDGAFDGWSLLIFHRVPFGEDAKKALTKKGWKILMVDSEAKCVEELKKGCHDVVMVISGEARIPHKDFIPLLTKHHQAGKGLLIAADNEPLYAEANAFLEPLFAVTLEGNTPADKTLSPGDPFKTGCFDAKKHMVTAGIDAAIYEGVTICYPTNMKKSQWVVFGTSSDNHPVLISTTDQYAGGEGKPGRIVLDCGFTKFYDGYFTKGAATDRYLTNAITWLANIECFDAPAKERK